MSILEILADRKIIGRESISSVKEEAVSLCISVEDVLKKMVISSGHKISHIMAKTGNSC